MWLFWLVGKTAEETTSIKLHHTYFPDSIAQKAGRQKKETMKILLVALSLTYATTSIAFTAQPRSVSSRNNLGGRISHVGLPVQHAVKNEEEINKNEAKDFELLSLPARPGRPLKVAIAGGGVGGLTAALCMLEKGFDVTVYEKTAAFARFGGPIQFASNALSVLKKIDEQLFDRVMNKFTFTGTRACGIKDGKRLYELSIAP